MNASSTVYLNQMSWHPLCIAQTCIGHETVLERTATEGTRTRIEFECYHLRGTKHTTTAMFQRRCSSQQPRRKKPTSHMNAPPPGVGNPPPSGRDVPQCLTSPLSSVICKTRQMPGPAPHRLNEEQLTHLLRTGPSTQEL